MKLSVYLSQVLEAVQDWEAGWGLFDRHPSLEVQPEALADALGTYTERLRGNYPFFHPRYAGQMLKPPHPAAIAAYLGAMLINPNNHALDGGPPTGEMEKEGVRALAEMFQLPEDTLGHLTSSGTLANLEALWVARELAPDKGVAFSAEAHYTHGRMGQVLGLETVSIPADDRGRIRLSALEERLKTGRIGTVVLTAGTTGLGSVDPIAEAVPLCQRYGCRIHIDAAYGGFFTLLAREEPGEQAMLAPEVARHFRAISACDSVAIDPHKHGLQPYGCGAVLFRDPSVGRFYQHDSPYTYFTSEQLHLGEISLECSRAGASAGAFWLTLQLLPLRARTGLGPVLSAGLQAARHWHELLSGEAHLAPLCYPELDIVTFYPRVVPRKASVLDAASHRFLRAAMDDVDNPVFLSVLRVESAVLATRDATLEIDQPQTRILRSVLMKPEHETYVDQLHERITELAKQITTEAP